MSRILKFICALLLLSSMGYGVASSQTLTEAPADTVRDKQPVRGIQFVADAVKQKRLPLLAGISVYGDVVGAVMSAVSPYGQYEAACRINLRGRFFPIAEIGWGMSDHTDETTDLHYKTSAPYFRIGCDYNFAKDVRSGNRIYGGLRYAFTSFDYDVDGPSISDPVWGGQTAFDFKGMHGAVQWAEFVFGLEAKIWSIFHLGWSVRYRIRTHNASSQIGSPWYVPGFGRNSGSALGGTFNVIFDI